MHDDQYITYQLNSLPNYLILHFKRSIYIYKYIHIKDANGKSFATRMGNVFVIGKGKKPFITLPKDNGLYLTPVEKK